MTESTLSLRYHDFAGRVGEYLGYGYDDAATPVIWTTAQANQIDRLVNEALLGFYAAHNWSFLHPVRTITLWATVDGTADGTPTYPYATGATESQIDFATGTTIAYDSALGATEQSAVGRTIAFDTSGNEYTITAVNSASQIYVDGDASGETADDGITITASGDYRLPDDFGDLDERPCFDPAQYRNQLEIVGPGALRNTRANTASSAGTPQSCSVVPLASSGVTGQRFDLQVWPAPNQDYDVGIAYTALQNKLTTSAAYPLGGSRHSATILQAVLAHAEAQINDQTNRHHRDLYDRMLAQSVRLDMEHAPEFLGRNRDRSGQRSRGIFVRASLVTYNNITPT